MAIITSALPLPGGRNLLTDPRLDTLTLNPRGALVDDTHPLGAPDGGSFFRRYMVTANTSSPQNGSVTPSGTAGVPVSPGQDITASIYRRRDPAGGGPSYRFDVAWFDAAGVTVAPTSNGATPAVGSAWARQVETFTGPAGVAFCSLGLTWTGIAQVNQTLDLAMAQFEYGSAASAWTDNKTLLPLLVLNYAVRRGSRNVVQERLASKYPTVFLREAQSKAGTLSLLFGDDASSREAEEFLSSANRFHFAEPTVGEAWDFVVTGDVTRTRQTGTSYWIVDAVVREVEP